MGGGGVGGSARGAAGRRKFRPVKRRQVRICWLAGTPSFAFSVSGSFARASFAFDDFASTRRIIVASSSFDSPFDVAFFLCSSFIAGSFSVDVVAGIESGSSARST